MIQKLTFLADSLTPVMFYQKIRDIYPGSVLFESSDFHVRSNSKSLIGFQPYASIELRDGICKHFEGKELMQEKKVKDLSEITPFIEEVKGKYRKQGLLAPFGFYGVVSYDINAYFPGIHLSKSKLDSDIPGFQFVLFENMIEIDHYTGIGTLHQLNGTNETDARDLLSSLLRRTVPNFGFQTLGQEQCNITEGEFLKIAEKGVEHCQEGDIFQVVLSRKFSQKYQGDDFWVYRSLRSINPGPYQYYLDFGDVRVMGSSPETQLSVSNGEASLHPIAGTVQRTGDDKKDRSMAKKLLSIPKENEEHNMLVDLGRNDLSRYCEDVRVTKLKEIQYYSHVIHMVSEVKGKVKAGASVLDLFFSTFPAGTLSGAPKYKAMELIDQYEPDKRGAYGGAIGFIGLDDQLNLAITIRSLVSMNGNLSFQAGA
ncbi:MAG: anthranilate synthase component 1, partial [Luteibaculaceae bacterium]